jgi:hypothetical protein
MALISQADLQARLGRTLTSDEATAFGVINAAVQSYVESLIGSSVESASASTRYFDGGVQVLSIDPCTDITAVKYVDEDSTVEYTFETSDYTQEPVNKTLKTYLRNRWGKFNRSINNVAVTAKFSIYGDTETLNIVKDAILNYLTGEIENSSNITKESIEGYSVEFASTESKSSLAPIKFLFPGV